MSGENPTEHGAGSFDLALYIGESREVQKNLVSAVDRLGTELKEFRAEVKQDFSGVKGTVAEHSTEIGVLKTKVATLEDVQTRQAETIAPIKMHPLVVTGIILSPIIAIGALVTSIFIAISR